MILCSHVEVARHLSESLVFLSFGHPEDLDFLSLRQLPVDVLLLVTQVGGRELFSQMSADIAKRLSMGMGWLYRLCLLFHRNIDTNPSVVMKSLQHGVSKVKSLYNIDKMHESVSSAIQFIES